MEGDAVAHAGGVGGFGPFADEVALRSHVHRVPGLIGGVPVVEVVVMHALHDEEARAGVVIDLDEFGGVELGGIPGVQHVLIAGFRGMAEVADVVVVGRGSRLIDFARVPVAALARGLRTEVDPEAELGLAQPGGASGIVFGDGLPGRLIGTGGDGEVHLDFGEGGRVLHGERVIAGAAGEDRESARAAASAGRRR